MCQGLEGLAGLVATGPEHFVCVCVYVAEWRWSQGGGGAENPSIRTRLHFWRRRILLGLENRKAGDDFINVKGRQWQVVAAVATEGG